MLLISKTNHCGDRSILALLNVYQKYLATFKLIASQVVQRARSLRMTTRIWAFIKIEI